MWPSRISNMFKSTYARIEAEDRHHGHSSSTQASVSDAEEKALSSPSEDDINETEGFLGSHRPHKTSLRDHVSEKWSSSVALHMLLLSVNLFLFTAYATGWIVGPDFPDPQHSQTPFRDYIKFEETPWDVLSAIRSDGTLNMRKKTVDLNGPPRPEYDQAWEELMAYENIRVSEDELAQFSGDPSLVKLSDGSGYYATVSFSHALHCIQRFHHYMYRDHYHPNLSQEESFSLMVHTDHCLDWLRQYVQCNADTTLIPLRWAKRVPRPITRDEGIRTCVASQPIQDFMAARSFDPFEPGLLIHPMFGDPFSNTTSSGTGAVVLPGGAELVGGE